MPPQKSSTILRRQLESGHHEVRIDAALEAVARIGVDAELAPGRRDVVRIPQRRLDQHVGGFSEQPVASPPMMPESDSTAFSSAMTHMAGIERVGLAVERQ